jgi:3-deoxy-7-phosphoheptulonate synthase
LIISDNYRVLPSYFLVKYRYLKTFIENMDITSDLHVLETRPLLSPAFIKSELPISLEVAQVVVQTRERIRNILAGVDKRVLVVVGPCSIHDVVAAKEYGEKLVKLRSQFQDRLEIVMRVYFEKPRTTVGWKGLINDPHLNDSYDINNGLKIARKLLLDLGRMGLPAATELLDPITPQYIADLICWTAIGARTTESQIHRQMASGLSMPVGYKNGTDGSFKTAINAISTARTSHHFLGINQDGLASIVRTTGNPDGHLVLRGGADKPNYEATDIAAAVTALEKAAVNSAIMIDCSHGNSRKDYQQQVTVLDNINQQIATGSPHIVGVMIESHLVAGNQSIPENGKPVVYGQSVTDACVDWETTHKMLDDLAHAVAQGRLEKAISYKL